MDKKKSKDFVKSFIICKFASDKKLNNEYSLLIIKRCYSLAWR
jgi:hypothetical protein